VSKFDDRLKDYVDVKERIRLFYEQYPEGRLVTTEVRATREPDDTPRVWVEAAAYRTAEDPLPGRGWSWLGLPGTTNFTRGSEIENAETSAWGRAIGALGIGIAASIASSDEVRAKAVQADVDHGADGSLIGTVQVGDKMTSDYSLRQTPDGPALGFRLRGDKGGILVRASGPLAVQLDAFRAAVVGARVTVWGTIENVQVPARGKSAAYSYDALTAHRVRVPEVGDLPTDTTADPVAAPDGSTALTEAESDAIWAEVERIGA